RAATSAAPATTAPTRRTRAKKQYAGPTARPTPGAGRPAPPRQISAARAVPGRRGLAHSRVMGDPGDRIRDLLASRRLTVELEQGLERRARLYADRLNQRLATHGDTDPYDVDD